MNNDLAQRVEELEVRVAFFEDNQQQLDDIVARQDETIAVLQVQLREVAKRMGDMAYSLEQTGSGGGEDRPPHY